MLTGENGLITKAQEAKDKTIEAAEKENQTLQEYENLLNEYQDGTNGDEGKPEVDLTNKNGLWIGSSRINGFQNEANKELITYYKEYTNATTTNPKNVSDRFILGYNDKKDSDGERIVYSLKEVLENEIIPNLKEYNEKIDFVVLEYAMGDVTQYSSQGKLEQADFKEIGTAEDKTSDTVINDYREAIEIINENLPDTKIILLNMLEEDRLACEQALFYSIIGYWEGNEKKIKTVDEINKELGANFKTYEEIRKYAFDTYPEMGEEAEWQSEKMDILITELEKVCRELGVGYLDFGDKISEKRVEGIDKNEYLTTDVTYLTDAGFKALTPLLAEKVKEILK